MLALLLAAGPARAGCPGDCDGNGVVSTDELVRAVAIALGTAPLDRCPATDADRDSVVLVHELIAAVSAALHGCPATATPAPTPTLVGNQPPILPTPSIYRSYVGFPIAVSVGANDPEGGAVYCSAAGLPGGAVFDGGDGVMEWTPAGDQVGPFIVPVSCADDALPPASADGQLIFQIEPLDACVVPSCAPATGCSAALTSVAEPCCASGPAPRVADAEADCPAGRVVFAGQNANPDSFGRMQNCDVMRVRNFQQSGAEVDLNIETRCVATDRQVRLRVRMESNAKDHPLLFDVETRRFTLADQAGGFARQRGLRFGIGGGGPFFDLQDAEANLFLTLTDEDGVATTEQLRVRLSFTPQPDRPDP